MINMSLQQDECVEHDYRGLVGFMCPCMQRNLSGKAEEEMFLTSHLPSSTSGGTSRVPAGAALQGALCAHCCGPRAGAEHTWAGAWDTANLGHRRSGPCRGLPSCLLAVLSFFCLLLGFFRLLLTQTNAWHRTWSGLEWDLLCATILLPLHCLKCKTWLGQSSSCARSTSTVLQNKLLEQF